MLYLFTCILHVTINQRHANVLLNYYFIISEDTSTKYINKRDSADKKPVRII